MATRTAHACAHRANTEALAQDELTDAARDEAEQHLEHCEPCRAVFRQQTIYRFPRIRNYTIVAELGRGGFGVVYKALHHGKERWEALKVLFGQTEQRTVCFENEVRLVAKLRHPNIATLYDANLHATPLYYAMELVQGQHLDDYFRAHDVSLEARIELVKTVTAAVGYAHRQDVIHRDLKPQNILIDPQGQPRIVDFGIAKRLVADTPGQDPAEATPPSPEGVLGTYGYISPEQLAGQNVDSRADIYCLGALLFHVITGQPAKFAPEAGRLRDVLREREVSRADDLAAIIALCVRPLPEQRYPTCEALVQDLDNYLAGRPLLARRDSAPGYRVARVAALVLRNHPLPVQAVAVLLVAYVLAQIFWYQGARWLSAGTGGENVALISVTPATLEAIRSGQIGANEPRLDVNNSKSLRLLYGRLMEKLAEAGPAVVVWDYYFPRCAPEFDAAFVRGMRAVKAPVIVANHDLDLNADPVLCPEIRAAAHGWGTVFGTDPGSAGLEGAVYVPLAIQRGLNPPIPSLALAALAAVQHSDCDVEIRVEPDRLMLQYRKRQVAGESRWPYRPDAIPLVRTEVAGLQAGGLQREDRCLFGGFQLDTIPAWVRNAIPLEQALTADGAQLQCWFAGRAVLIGQMIPPQDQRRLPAGGTIFGCQVQALVLNDLLSGAGYHRFGRWQLALMVGACCIVSGILVNCVRVRATWPTNAVKRAAIAALCLAVAVALVVSPEADSAWVLWGTAAACALLGAGAVTLLINVLHVRQLHLVPGQVWSAEGTTASTTLVAGSQREPAS
jgi:predicted Ser/Thr protein kinase